MAIDTALFNTRLQEVKRSTRILTGGFDFENGSYGKVFRQTNPVINGVEAFNIAGDYPTWNIDDSIENYIALLDAALEARKAYGPEDFHPEGKVLRFEIGISTRDGAAMAESRGFLDASDVPPIDTWFYLDSEARHPLLYCWIPEGFVEIVDKGIAAEILDSYDWV